MDKNISDLKTFNILLNVPQLKKKGKKYQHPKNRDFWKKKNFVTPFSAIFFQGTFGTTLLQDFDPFWYDLPFISLLCQNFDDKKTPFFVAVGCSNTYKSVKW